MDHIIVRIADATHVEGAKRLADANRDVFSFLARAAFEDARREQTLLIALDKGRVVGFVRYHHRQRDTHTTLYDICVDEALRGRGIGGRMLHNLKDDCRTRGRTAIGLKCPVGSRANRFYAVHGFSLIATLPGTRRPINLWWYDLKNEGEA